MDHASLSDETNKNIVRPTALLSKKEKKLAISQIT
jgi:hypothetical protein